MIVHQGLRDSKFDDGRISRSHGHSWIPLRSPRRTTATTTRRWPTLLTAECCWMTLCSLLISVASGLVPGIIEGDNVAVTHIEAVQGSTARMPCDVTPTDANDSIRLVIWYKDGLVSPIYSFDARNVEKDEGNHWSDVQTLNGRGYFQEKASPAVFAIETVRSSDTGLYRCRVDFQKNPTRNSQVNLTVITPPDNVLILDERGAHITHYILGPYNEGSKIYLTCVATGGRPQPRLTWWRENSLIDDSFMAMSEKKVKNVLHLEKLERHHLHAQYTCQASNNNVTTPISSAVTINLNLRPLWVKMQGENKPLSAGGSYGLVCEVVGSRPKPVITWWKGSILMKNSSDVTSADGNVTTSTLTFTPTIDDSGKYLSCRAEQPLIPDSGLESGWKLDIHHVPVVSLELGSNLNNSTTIREGADVYFECNIKSNPWVYKVGWRHNGRFLYNNAAAGIIVANQSLVLQNVTRARSGSYTCIGSNEEGDGESNTVQLDIKFAPLCRLGQVQTYNIARQETAKIVCELEANPNDVHFTWKFNTSNAENLDLPASLIAVDRAKSVAHYTPMTEQDYGTLICWGSNDIGIQSEPCIFDINPAGKPDPLSNCTVSNQTANVLQLECIEGFDGGLPQTFEVDVYYARTKNLVTNQSSNVPVFVLKGLHPDFGYDIVLTAKNAKGKSAETIHHMNTLNGAEKHTDEFPSLDFLLPYTGNALQTKLLLGAAVGLVFGVTVLLIASTVMVRRNRRKAQLTALSGAGGGTGVNGDNLSSTTTVGTSSATSATGTRSAGLHHDRPTTAAIIAAAGDADLLAQMQSALGSTANAPPLLMGDDKTGGGGAYIGCDAAKMRMYAGAAENSDGFDANPDIIPLKGKDDGYFDQRKKLNWNYPNHAYTTVAMANQYENQTSAMNHQQQQQQRLQHHYDPNQPDCQRHYLMINDPAGGGDKKTSSSTSTSHAPVSSYSNSLFENGVDDKNKEVTYAALQLAIPKQKAIYTSATLGRQRNKVQRPNEPTIYAQIDLAHGHANHHHGGPAVHQQQQQQHHHSGQLDGYPPVSWVTTPRQVHQLLQSKPTTTSMSSAPSATPPPQWHDEPSFMHHHQQQQQQHQQQQLHHQMHHHQALAHHQQQLPQLHHQQQQQHHMQRLVPIMCSKESNPSTHNAIHDRSVMISSGAAAATSAVASSAPGMTITSATTGPGRSSSSPVPAPATAGHPSNCIATSTMMMMPPPSSSMSSTAASAAPATMMMAAAAGGSSSSSAPAAVAHHINAKTSFGTLPRF